MPSGEFFTSYEQREGLFRWRIQKVALVVLLPLPFLLPFWVSTGELSLISQMYIFAMAVLGLNVILGYAGEIVLAQGAFMMIGAYTTSQMIDAGTGFLPGLFMGGLLTAAVAVVFGLPSFRVKGFYIAITTLALQFIAEWFFNNGEMAFIHGGTQQTMPAEIGLLGEFFVLSSRQDLYYLTLVVMLGFALISLNLSRTSYGRVFRAIHENDLSAAVLGVNVFRNKLLAFAIGGFMIGVSGGLFGYYIGFVDPGFFGLNRTLEQYVMLLFGGMGRVWGALLGVGVVTFVLEFLRNFLQANFPDATALVNVFFGFIIITVLAVEPKGVLAALGQLKEYLQKWPYAY
jgi:branched-chain amino acid transport system permease protein